MDQSYNSILGSASVLPIEMGLGLHLFMICFSFEAMGLSSFSHLFYV